MSTWVRTIHSSLAWTSGSQILANVPRGSTLIRVHFGWGWEGTTAADAGFVAVASNLQVMGLVTTVGNGSESVPNARTASGDAAPPTQRWVYWEGRAGTLVQIDPTGTTAFWQDTRAQEPVDTKGMVSGKGIPSGDTLNLWASWAAAGDWPVSGTVDLWCYASILYQ